MALTHPYVTEKFTAYKAGVRITRLTLALWLKDDYTGKEPLGNVKVMIKKNNLMAYKNLSGYHIFTDLPDGSYDIDIEPGFYFPEKKSFDTAGIRTLDTTLEFSTNGPAAGAKSVKLKDVSVLQKGDMVEFRNTAGEIEMKSIVNINPGTKSISWTGGLMYSFKAAGSIITALRNSVIETILKPLPSYPFPNNATLARGVLADANNIPVAGAVVSVVDLDMETESDEKGEFVIYFTEFKNKDITIQIQKNGETKSIGATLAEWETKSLGIIKFP